MIQSIISSAKKELSLSFREDRSQYSSSLSSNLPLD